ncbi:MAG TPA: Mrp/NBP35 family ATP-binding protein [Acidimicrobiales bacterium]|nr:Mrp/NBP35 family ATP-binding protein [Acidimicrobiales bacterium]
MSENLRDAAEGTTDVVQEADVRASLARVEHPELHVAITDLGMVQGVLVGRGRVQLSVASLVRGDPSREHLRAEIVRAVRVLGVDDVVVDFTTMSDADRAALRRRLQRQVPPSASFASTRVFLVASGKGGVGKSSVTANLALSIARRGRRVAVIDADVYGFSIPRMLGIDRQPLIIDGLLVPPEIDQVAVVSVGFFTDEGTPVIWRGAMLHKMLQQFVDDVWWGRPDVLLVDMPPGTGDVSLTIGQLFPDAEVVVVTTPQPAAQRVAQRAAYMAQRINLQVAGVVENMSWFTDDDGTRYDLFGTGGGQLLATELGVPLVGQVPLVPALRQGCDVGTPIVVADPAGEAATALELVADRLLALHQSKAHRPELRVQPTR